jgi:tetratricopeptide (TPR) repeat protein
VLRIYPKQYQSLFYPGKFYQKQNNYKKALLYFEELISSGRASYHIVQEASLMAMGLNQVEKAVAYSKQSLTKKPAGFVVPGNHPLNLLTAGFDFEASATIDKAIGLKPDNIVTKRVKAKIECKIECVIAGQSMRPTFESPNSFTRRIKLPGLYYPGLLEYFQ